MEDPNQTRSIIYSSNPVAKHKEVLFLKRVVEWTKKKRLLSLNEVKTERQTRSLHS